MLTNIFDLEDLVDSLYDWIQTSNCVDDFEDSYRVILPDQPVRILYFNKLTNGSYVISIDDDTIPKACFFQGVTIEEIRTTVYMLFFNNQGVIPHKYQ